MRFWAVLLLLVLLLGCQQRPSGIGDPLTGREGIVVHKTYVPPRIYENEQFSVSFDLENRGGASVLPENPGYFFVSYDKLYLKYVDSVSRFSGDSFWLLGREQFRQGDQTFITLFFETYPVDRFSQAIDTQLLFTICYPYVSEIIQQVCIENVHDPAPGAVACKNTPVRPQTPAAPIGVSQIDVRTRRVPQDQGGGLVPSFRIGLENYQGGIPSITACNSPGPHNLSTVYVRAWLLDEPLECGGVDPIVHGPAPVGFFRNQGMVTCSLRPGSTIDRGLDNFISLLSIRIDYTYRESDTVGVHIERE